MIARLRNIIDFFKDSKNTNSPPGFPGNNQNDSEHKNATGPGTSTTTDHFTSKLSKISSVSGSRDSLFRDAQSSFGVLGNGISVDKTLGLNRNYDDGDDSYRSATEGDYLSAVSDNRPISRESSYFSASEGRNMSPLWILNRHPYDSMDTCSDFTDSEATSPPIRSGLTSPTYTRFDSLGSNYMSNDDNDSTTGHELLKCKNYTFFNGVGKAGVSSHQTNEEPNHAVDSTCEQKLEAPTIKLSKFFTNFAQKEAAEETSQPIQDSNNTIENMEDVTDIQTDAVPQTIAKAYEPFQVKPPENCSTIEVSSNESKSPPKTEHQINVVEESSESVIENHNAEKPKSDAVKPSFETLPLSQENEKETHQNAASVDKIVTENVEPVEIPPDKDLLNDLENLIAWSDNLKSKLLLGQEANMPTSLKSKPCLSDNKVDTVEQPSVLTPKETPKSGDLYDIKVVEIEPKLTTLGENIDEAVGLQREHDEILRQIQGKTTPIEEFARKADKLLAKQQAHPQILDAMGKSLSLVWEDILKLVHDRKHLLDLCANFHEKMGSCRGKMASLEVACKDTMIPIEIEAVQEFLNKFKQLRIDVLTAVMSSLKDGNELLAKLQEIAQTNAYDSRPDHIKRDAIRAINQVQQWLENLHDRRNNLETAWQTRKVQLEQCLALAILAKDLDELESALLKNRNSISGTFSLGECEHSATKALQEYIDRKQDALLLRDRGLKITRTTEKLVSSGCFAGDEACSRTYGILNNCSEYFEIVDQREHWLHQSKDFFNKAEKTLSVLERLEIELSTIKFPPNSPEAITLYSKVLKDLESFTEEPLRIGYSILDDVGRTIPETQGIKRVLEEIENRKIYIEGMCSESTEQKLKVTRTIQRFMEQYNIILSWLVSIAEAFLRSTNILGDNLLDARQFLHLHHQLMQDLEIKGESINNLLLSIKDILESLEPRQRYDIDTKAESLHKHWIELKEIVLKRVDLVTLYIEFLEKAEKLANMFDELERKLSTTPEEDRLQEMESNWGQLKAAYGNLKAIGMRFLSLKVADPYLDTKSACSSVEEILDRFSNRQFDITTSWEKWTTSVVEKRETQIICERIMTESLEAIDQATHLDTHLYPVLTSKSEDPSELSELTKQKLTSVLGDIEKAQNEIVERIGITENLKPKDPETIKKIEQINENLHTMKQRLDIIKYDYSTLLESILNFLENIRDIQGTIHDYFVVKQQTKQQNFVIAIDREQVTRDSADHEYFRENIMSKFRSLISQSEKLIERVRVLEPQGAKEHDTDRILTLLEKLRINFENHNEKKMSELEKSRSLTNFDSELSEINGNLDNLSSQLLEIQGEYGDTLAAAKTTSLAFEYFERTIELLDKRIEHFVKTSENIYSAYPDTETYITNETEKVKYRWTEFRELVRKTRSAINFTNEYFLLLEKVEIVYREISAFYVAIANKIPLLKDPIESSNLINDIEKYLSQYEQPQLERLSKLRSISEEIYKTDKTTTIYTDNVTLFQSFAKLKVDISTIEERLRSEEKLKDLKIKEAEDEARRKAEEDEKRRAEEEARRRAEEEARERAEVEARIKAAEEARRRVEEEARRQAEEEARRKAEEEARRKAEEDEAHRKAETERARLEAEAEAERIRKEQVNKERKEAEALQKKLSEEEHRKLIEIEHQIKIVEEEQHRKLELLKQSTARQNGHFENIEDRHERKEVHEVCTKVQYSLPEFIVPLKDATIKEGEKFTFSCQVTGNPKPVVEWFKDNISIQNNPDYHTTFDNGKCTLSIEETFSEDSAHFMCRATNMLGVAESIAILSVREHSTSEEMVAPQILKPLVNGFAREGSCFQFSCAVTGQPLPTVQWFKNDKCIDDSPYYVITYNNGEATLKFEEVFLEDRAVFTCKASNPAGSVQCFANLNVEPLEPTEIPTFKVPLSNVMARVGQKLKLECVVSGIPRPDLFWTHNGRPFISRDVKYDGENVTLIIPEAYPKDSGVYVCTAKNLAGENHSTCNVSVKGRLPNETSDSELASDMEPIKPSVQLPLKNVAVFEGKFVRLDCVIVGQPEPEVIWYHNERPVKESADVQLLFQGDGCSLVIQEADLEDAGTYKVVAINSAGEASSSCTLSVTPLNTFDQSPRAKSERATSNESTPKFEKFLTDVLADEGSTVELECAVSGDPRPTVKWYLSNIELVESDRITFIERMDGVCKLLIKNVSANDKGVYTVKASNSSGDAKCFSHLIVKCVNTPEAQYPQMEPEEKFVSPTFKELFSDQNAQPGEMVKFECIVVGKPTPKIKWFFNDLPVHGKHFLVSTSGDRQVLTVPETSGETIGKIACVAENDYGKATCVANLNLLGDGFQPSAVQKSIIQNHNSSGSNITISKQILTTTATSHVSSSTNGHPQVMETSQFEERQSAFGTPVSSVQKSTISKSFELDSHKTGRRQVAPRFVSPLVGKIVDQGANVTLEAIYDGYPSPEIKILKNNDELQPSDHIEIKKELNRVFINLQNVGIRDAGRYSVTASNTSGTSTSSADVVVKKTIFPPVFGHRLQAQVAKRGERVLMDVEVTGTPDPTVTWYKDNYPLREALSSEHRIKSEGNRHTLIIEKVSVRDSGKYMVKATNAGGEAQSIADFAVLEPTPERMVEVVKTVVYDDLKDFKEEKPKHSEGFHTKTTESSTKSDAHGTTESTIVTEHRCVTEATMKLEHKMPDIEFPLKTKTEPLQPKVEEPPKTTKVPLDFGMPKFPSTVKESSQIQESRSVFERKEFVSEPIFPGTRDSKLSDLDSLPKITPKLVQMEERRESETKSCFSPSSLEDFKLKPGSPPVMGYVPPLSEPPKGMQSSVSEKIKKVEEYRQPPSAFSPLISQKSEYSKTFVQETKQFTSNASPIYRPQAVLGSSMPSFDRSQSPKPSAEGVKMEKLWAAPKSFEPENVQKQFTQEIETNKYVAFSDSDAEPGVVVEPPRPTKETKEIFEEKIKEHKEKQSAWVPELRAPSLVKQTVWKPEAPQKPKPVTPDLINLNLEPGPPPEILFAPQPPTKSSHIEKIEQTLKESFTKEPAKVVHGAVRTMPPFGPQVPPKDVQPTPPPVPTRPIILEKPAEIYSTFSPPEVPPKPAPPPVPSYHPVEYNPRPVEVDSKPPKAVSSGYSTDTEEFRTFESRSVQESRKLFESHSTNQSHNISHQQYKPYSSQPSTPESFAPVYDKGYSSAATMVKNISMTTKQVREPKYDSFSQTPEPKKVPPPPSPSKFSRSEYRESDYSSDYDSKIQSVWRPPSEQSDAEMKSYRPMRTVLTPTSRSSNISTETKSPAPATGYETPPARSKFEPVRYEESSKLHSSESHTSHVFKPKPLGGRPVTSTPKQPPQPQKPQSYTTQYYTGVAGPPVHHASMATETSKSVHMKESTETSHRVMNMSQTKRVLHFDQNKRSSHETPEPLEPFPYTVTSPVSYASSPRPRIQVTPTPTKFVPGGFRESDYESQIENARIRPIWTPNPYDQNDPQYRHVNPPRPSRSTSLPRSYERVMTPMEFDKGPIEMPSKIPITSSTTSQTGRTFKTQTIDRYATRRSLQTMQTTKDDMNLQVGSPPKYGYFQEQAHHHTKDFGSTLRTKTNKFVQDISSDLKSPQIIRPDLKRAPSEGNTKPQAYREESRVSQYGTKHIDPDTGLIYFKYDFGYEFGILFPGEGRKFIGGGGSNSSKSLPTSITRKSPYSSDIVIPVQHERTSPKFGNFGKKHQGFTSTDSEFSQINNYGAHARKRYSLPGDINIDDFHRNVGLYNKGAVSEHFTSTSTSQSSIPIPVNAQIRDERPRRPPLFITPLKDIAVLIGQTARFECIVQCEPYPNITWSKNGFPLHNSNKHVIEFRNGVCRLTIPDAYPDDAAMYSCTGTNEIGSGTTTAELTVQGHRAPRQ